MSQSQDMRRAHDDVGRAWHAYKEENGKGRKSDPHSLTRINKDLDRLEGKFKRLETAMLRGPRASLGGDAAVASPERKAFAKFLRQGEAFLAPPEVKVLTLGDDTQAGYSAPAEYLRELIKGVSEVSPMRTVCRLLETSQRSLEIPKRTGQFNAAWVGETESRSETTGLTFGLEEIPTHELTAEVYMSLQMLEDAAFDMEAELIMEFTERFGVAEGTTVVAGNSVKRPEGFLNHADVAETNSGSAATIADANGQANGVIDLYHDIKTEYARNGSWVLNRQTLASVRKLKDSQNNYIWQPGLANGIANTILGSPYLEVPDMPNEAAGAFPIAFGDWRRAYIIVDRVNMSVLRDPFTRASSGQVKFVARRRVGGQVVLAEAIRKLKCSA